MEYQPIPTVSNTEIHTYIAIQHQYLFENLKKNVHVRVYRPLCEIETFFNRKLTSCVNRYQYKRIQFNIILASFFVLKLRVT